MHRFGEATVPKKRLSLCRDLTAQEPARYRQQREGSIGRDRFGAGLDPRESRPGVLDPRGEVLYRLRTRCDQRLPTMVCFMPSSLAALSQEVLVVKTQLL